RNRVCMHQRWPSGGGEARAVWNGDCVKCFHPRTAFLHGAASAPGPAVAGHHDASVGRATAERRQTMAFISLSDQPDYTFPPGTFDVRGWDVRTMADDEKVGKIDDIILDESGNPRYLDVDLGLFQKHVLLPIGQARVDETEDQVLIPGMTKEQFKDVPEYAHDPNRITSGYEEQLTTVDTGAYTGEHYYSRPEYAAERPRMTGRASAEGGRLAMISDLDDFEVAHEDPDPRDWEVTRSEEHTSELQSRENLVCRLLL